MKYILSILLLTICIVVKTNAQNIGINADGSLPNANAILDIKASDKGLLIPRTSTVSRTAIPNTKGLLVYDTTMNSFWYNDGSAWQQISNGAALNGTLNYLPKFTGTTTVGNSQIVDNGQNVGIGTTAPLARLHVADSSVLFSAAGDVPATPHNTPISLGGRRLMWYPDKAAFRVGYAANNEWDSVNIGKYSVAIGAGSKASGLYSSAIGHSSVASATCSYANGEYNNASGDYSISFGQNSTASKANSFAAGFGCFATGVSSIAMGDGSVAGGDHSVVLGSGFATGYGSYAMGDQAQAKGINSYALGNMASAGGDNSYALGYNSNASAANSYSLGYEANANGLYSFAANLQTIASGNSSFAIGGNTVAGGGYSFASGFNTSANGSPSFVFGSGSQANQIESVAIGDYAKSDAVLAIAMGQNVTAGGDHSFVWGVNSNTTGRSSLVMGINLFDGGHKGNAMFGDTDPWNAGSVGSGTDDQMICRFNNGYYFITGGNTNRTGMVANHGDNSWSQISDSTKKEKLIPVNGEELLNKISKFKLTTWNYKGQDSKIFRHYGPMAQDFHNAFGHDALGSIGCDTLINQADFLGVSFTAIQALEKRTEKIEQQQKQISSLQQQNALLVANNDKLQKQLELLTGAVSSLDKKINSLAVIQNNSNNVVKK